MRMRRLQQCSVVPVATLLLVVLTAILAISRVSAFAWTAPQLKLRYAITRRTRATTRQQWSALFLNNNKQDDTTDTSTDATTESLSSQQRRSFLTSTTAAILLLPLVSQQQQPAHAEISRAVGSGERECRAQNNCLERGELDGALGWDWGGKDRCDPANPLCGADGKLRAAGADGALLGQPVPGVPSITSTTDDQQQQQQQQQAVVFTHVAAIQIEIGRGEVGVLKLGLYGNQAPVLVQQLVDFLSEDGLITTNGASQKTIGGVQVPVSLATGGVVTDIVPGTTVALGVPSQANAYAKSRGKSKAGDGFVPQPRPAPLPSESSTMVRPHDRAGLVSVPAQGLGYGGTGFESNDEAFEAAVVVTDNAVPAFDNNKNKQQQRLVVGQVLDSASMAFLERLANLPTKRGIRGVIPGQTSGPPLPKVVVRQVQVSKVTAPS